MQTKLTLRMDGKIIRKAKVHARRTGRSLSRMVADYFTLLDRRNPGTEKEPPGPLVRTLSGCLKGSGVDQMDYHKHLEERHL